MAKSLKMVFAVGDAKTATLSLAEPKDGLTKAEVQTALDEMVEKKAITVGGARCRLPRTGAFPPPGCRYGRRMDISWQSPEGRF